MRRRWFIAGYMTGSAMAWLMVGKMIEKGQLNPVEDSKYWSPKGLELMHRLQHRNEVHVGRVNLSTDTVKLA